MNVGLPDVVRDKLKILKGRYIESLPDRVESLLSGLQAVEQTPVFILDTFFTAQNAAHRIVGSGQTFGFTNLSNIARLIEQQIELCIKEQRPPLPTEKEQITQCTQELSILVEKVVTEGRGKACKNSDVKPDSRHTSTATKSILIWGCGSLLLEDLKEQIGFFGFEVEIVRSAEMVEERLANSHSILLIVLIDSLKENPQFFQRLTALKKAPKAEKLKVLYLSEVDDFNTRLLSVRNGGDGFLSTPLDIPCLIEKIDALFDESEEEPYHVMIIDDDPEQISYYAMILQAAGMVTSVVTDPTNVVQVLVEDKPDLILMDMYMPSCRGEELAAIIRQQEAFVGIPIIYFSVEKDRDIQIAAIHLGKGDDFLTKPIKPEHLVKVVKTRADRIRQLRYFMERDSLTGLLNHTQLRIRLLSELDRTKRLGTHLVYAMIDLDHFKKINDEFGHLLGDHVLRTLSRLFMDRLRKTDSLGRYGGEEFGIVLFNTTIENGLRVLNELRESFARIRHSGGERDFQVTFSCGVADFPRFSTVDALVSAADKALYLAKSQGRNTVVAAP